MAYIEPNSELRLLAGINIDQDYNHTLFFNSRERQAAFFKSRTVKTFDKLSYQRKERGYIRVNCIPEEVYGCNYMMYKNTNFDPQNLERWIYCFVESIEYINNNCAEIHYTVDRMQTWMFDYKLGDCLVDREHTLTDNIDEHLTPEPIAPFEFTFDNDQTTSVRKVYKYFAACVLLKREIKSAVNPGGGDIPLSFTPYKELGTTTGAMYAYVGVPYSTNERNIITTHQADYVCSAPVELSNFLHAVAFGIYKANNEDTGQQTKTTADDIISVFIYPLENFYQQYLVYDYDVTDAIMARSEQTISITRPEKFTYGAQNEYAPRNAKILSAPFCVLRVADLNGNEACYKYELFTPTNGYYVSTKSNLIGSGVTIISPKYYQKTTDYTDSSVPISIDLSTYWSNSNVADYMRNNRIGIIGSAIGAAGELMGGVFTSAGLFNKAQTAEMYSKNYADLATNYKKGGRRYNKLMGQSLDFSAQATDLYNQADDTLVNSTNAAISGGAEQLAAHALNTLKAAEAPNKTFGGTTEGNTDAAFNRCGYTIRTLIPIRESAQQIDDYFDRFGYKLLTTHRPYVDEAKTGDRPVSDLRGVWNYIKTVDCVVHHSNPDSAAIGYSAQDEAIIASIYNKGITFWFDNEKIGDYNNYRNANSIFNPQPGPTPPPVPTTKNGIDISRVNVNCYWNDEIDNWSPVTAFDMDSVKNSGGDYALLRIGGADEYGDTTDVQQGFYFDGAFESSYQAARAAGLKVGAYYLVNCMTVQEAVAEVNHIVSLFQQFNYPVLEGGFWLDIELNAVPEGKTRRFTSASASVQNAMLAELKAGIVNGIAPYAETFVGLYTNPSGLEHYGFKSLSVYAQTPLWLAYWSDYYDKGNPPEYILEKIRQLPDYPAIWQYGQNKLGVRAYNGTLVDGDYIYPPGWTPSQQ